MVFMLSRRKHGRKFFSKSKRRRCTNITSHVNSSKSNDLNTYNSDNVIVNSNLRCIDVHTELSSNKKVTFQKETDTVSSTSINEENMDESNAIEEMSSNHNSIGVIDHTCDENVINLLNTEEEAYFTSIKSVNGTNDMSMNDYEKCIHKCYAPFLP